MLYVHATIELKPGQREKFLVEFRRIVPLVRAEAGCLEYSPAIDLATDLTNQAPLRPDTVVVVEKWDSLDALKAHLVAPHMMQYRPKVRDLIERSTLQILESAAD